MVKVINLAGGRNTDAPFSVVAIEKNLYEDIKNGRYYVNLFGGRIDFDWLQDCLYDFIDEDIADFIYDFIVKFEGNIIDENEDITAIPVEVVDTISRRFGIKKVKIEELFDDAFLSTSYNNNFEGSSSISKLEIKYGGELNTYAIVTATTLW